MTKIKIKGNVRVNTYAIISRAIEEGLEYGWNRAHKHTNTPSKETILIEQENAVMLNLDEVLIYDSIEDKDEDTPKIP